MTYFRGCAKGLYCTVVTYFRGCAKGLYCTVVTYFRGCAKGLYWHTLEGVQKDCTVVTCLRECAKELYRSDMPQRVCKRTVLYRLTCWSIPLDHWLGSTGTKCSCKSVQEQESLFAFRPEPLSQRTWTHCLCYSKPVICLIFPALIRNNAICCKRHWLVVFMTEW